MSDGRKGHEIQSTTVAENLSMRHETFQFELKQPWQWLAPRRLPGFKNAVVWSNDIPMESQQPDLIITAGRQAAAVGKHVLSNLQSSGKNCQHIQILNPRDNPAHYDLLLLPEHDQVTAPNVITYIGSIHPFNKDWFGKNSTSPLPLIGIMLGELPTAYFKSQFIEDLSTVRNAFPNSQLFVCGSRRLSATNKQIIKTVLHPKDKFWFNDSNKQNPYQHLLKNAEKLFVTSDSINMISECSQSSVPLSVLGKAFTPSVKHQRFLESVSPRLCQLANTSAGQPTIYAMEQIINHPKVKRIIN